MIVYKVYRKDFTVKKGTLLGILTERRADLRGQSPLESGLTWAKAVFCRSAADKRSLFVVPMELETGKPMRLPAGKGALSLRQPVDMLDSPNAVQRTWVLTGGHAIREDGKKSQPSSLLDDRKYATPCQKFYGFSERPFDASSDPKFFFLGPGYRDALASMIVGIREQKGFISLTGEPGTGKTALVQLLLSCLGGKVQTLFIHDRPSTFEEMLKSILLELGVKDSGGSRKTLPDQLHDYVTHRLPRGKTLVVIFDEARPLPAGVLKELGQLLAREGRLRIIFVGETRLDGSLNGHGSRILRRTTGIRCRIRALSQAESKQYMDYRLRLAGANVSEAFTPVAVSTITQYAQGIPRTLNILCENALQKGYASSKPKVDEAIVHEVIKEMEDGTLLASLRDSLRGECDLREPSYRSLAHFRREGDA
jgi:general secretion pathway protein A